ncbi:MULTISPECIES: TetR/AcrR family transcriptional regulator C-terminal domain-containing protein [Thermomonospora]|uniref:AcrR family transcriptional regulator n=1 Tax=Thermomonospora cellulosilytica TaxID=1411118 RepID=A0A7W3MZW0_9ACTN|nr:MULTISPECIES: TetR/AcrR family transcriptional regulator C-terminal domain-containing protein [Thermomonospora]MBA9004897.1 AcrR family transcriptional regulator [Thermomonospora cellulosilytica]
MPRPRSLTEAQIAAAALAVIDRDGLGGLTMRAVAKEIGVSTMALYRYVEDREHLESLVVDHMLAAVDVTPPAAPTWRERAMALCERARAAIDAHPAAVPLTLVHRHTAPNAMRFAEALLGVLAEAGFTGERRAIALRALLGQLFGSLALMRLGPLGGPGTAALAALPDEEFPLLADTARHARPITPDEEFRRGLELVLRGMSPG